MARQRHRISIEVDEAWGPITLEILTGNSPDVFCRIIGIQFRKIGLEFGHYHSFWVKVTNLHRRGHGPTTPGDGWAT